MQTDDDSANGLMVMSIILCSIATFAVIARSIIRCFVLRNFWWDDFTILTALIFTLGYLGELLFLRANGMGLSSRELTTENMVNFLKAALAVEITYYVAVGFIKTSILLLYLRFAVSERLRKFCYATIVFEAVFSVVCMIVVLAQCTPLKKALDIDHSVQGTCIDTTAFFYSTSGINIITDIWIIGLPVKALRGTNRPQRELAALIIIFGVGILACIMSIVRLHSIFQYTLSTDPFYDAIPVNMWSMIELNVAILCASVPSLKLLISPKRLRQVMYEKRHKFRCPNSNEEGRGRGRGQNYYFSDEEHSSFVRERMASLPANLIAVETVSLTEVVSSPIISPAVTTDSGARHEEKSRRLTKLPSCGGSDRQYHREGNKEEEEDQDELGFLRQTWSQGSVKSFCYAGEFPGLKD